MGGEGAQWIGMAPFIDREHLFQNIGDGTFFHSGSLAVRAAVAAGVNITYKLLYNSAVAMTGGQQAGRRRCRVPGLTRLLLAEGVRRIIVTTEDPRRYRRRRCPRASRSGTATGSIEAQEVLAAVPGVTVLIHDQECAAEKRRKRKRGLAPDAGRAGHHQRADLRGLRRLRREVQLPVGPAGRRPSSAARPRIHQSSCNKDYSCLDGTARRS